MFKAEQPQTFNIVSANVRDEGMQCFSYEDIFGILSM